MGNEFNEAWSFYFGALDWVDSVLHSTVYATTTGKGHVLTTWFGALSHIVNKAQHLEESIKG